MKSNIHKDNVPLNKYIYQLKAKREFLIRLLRLQQLLREMLSKNMITIKIKSHEGKV